MHGSAPNKLQVCQIINLNQRKSVTSTCFVTSIINYHSGVLFPTFVIIKSYNIEKLQRSLSPYCFQLLAASLYHVMEWTGCVTLCALL